MARQTGQNTLFKYLKPIGTLSFPVKTWLMWLVIQGCIQAIGFHHWELALMYGAAVYGFSQLGRETKSSDFNQRLTFWLSVFLVFLYGRALVFIYGTSFALLSGNHSPTRLIFTLTPLLIESGWVVGLKRVQKGDVFKTTQQVIVDMETGEILKEMA